MIALQRVAFIKLFFVQYRANFAPKRRKISSKGGSISMIAKWLYLGDFPHSQRGKIRMAAAAPNDHPPKKVITVAAKGLVFRPKKLGCIHRNIELARKE
jgi:hypothetical protein